MEQRASNVEGGAGAAIDLLRTDWPPQATESSKFDVERSMFNVQAL